MAMVPSGESIKILGASAGGINNVWQASIKLASGVPLLWGPRFTTTGERGEGGHEACGSFWKAQATHVSDASKCRHRQRHGNSTAAVVTHDGNDVAVASGVVHGIIRAEHR